MLADCPRLHVLVTSRAPLRLSGERELAGPAAGAPGRPPPAAARAALAATRPCGCSSSAARRAPRTLTAEDAAAVAEICIRLDGLPLALELAASRLRVLSPPMLLERLGHALPLLVGGPRDMPARQRTLTATIAWSHDLLDAAEQRLFRRISVFVGGFTLDAAEAVCGDAELGLAVLDGLESLLEKSLLGRQDGDRGTPRFRMLETVREYAVERASAAGELAEFRRRHAAYFLSLAEWRRPSSPASMRRTWLQRLEADHNNLRAALSWALESTTRKPRCG